MNTKVTATNKLNALTSLRFFAAAMIVIYHSRGHFGIKPDLWNSFPLGLNVSFFFVLSGFILAYVYPTLKGAEATKRFLVARFARIWPLHIATSILLILFIPNAFSFDLATFANLAMVHSWVPLWDYFFSGNSPSWSIATEFAFYLCFPLLIFRWERTWWLKLIVTFLIAFGVVSYCNYNQIPPGEANGGVGYIGLVGMNPLARLFEFTLGMTMVLLWRKVVPRYKVGQIGGTLIELLMLGIVFTVMRNSADWATLVSTYPWVGSAGAMWLNQGGIPCFFFGLFIVVMALEKGIISRFLSLPLLVLLGEISFSVYLVHYTLIRYYGSRPKAFSYVPEWLAYTVFWLVLLLASHLLWTLVERPCRQFIIDLWSKRRAAGAGTQNRITVGKSLRWFSKPGKISKTFLPRRRSTMVEAVLLIGLLIPIVLQPNIQMLNSTTASALINKANPEVRNITFGEHFVLLGVATDQTQEALKIDFVWKSLKKQRLKYLTFVHILDSTGNILAQADFKQDEGKQVVNKGTLWHDLVKIPGDNFKDAKTIGIGLYQKSGETLAADQGSTDWDKRRLLISLK